ncbi:MAG: metal-dependent hydrolase [Desulfurococcales archaeon]|nr:metal-dependent hydrolase [Desulfurococcales archaeon]
MGFNLLLTSAAAYLLGLKGFEVNAVIIASTALSTLPDIDIRLRITHRKYTHNIFFGLAAGVALGLATHWLGIGFLLGFASAVVGVGTHLLADLMTYRGFNPVAPLGGGVRSLKLFRSSNRAVNDAFLVAGAITYLLYVATYGPLTLMK